ncbi:CHAT domain-containing protein [Couchioplanes azureus]|uniref:CHAT domain-containing protein n=1 Tax=Couchioplanes caeruleus TaxID=56438 RepID=UPI001670390E|nr:CHAT domain-containing protein [Couchioplanes caeruleus]GGQ75565.1 hypothetical protein GCM10010166_52000 [Couchioplanes caeruleus subsp. azureus]
MYSDRIKDFADKFHIDDLILRYDVDFDIPLRHEYALGVLRMVEAFRPVSSHDLPAVARRVGAHWCDIVRSDMVYDHWAALRMIEASADDAAALLDVVRADPHAGGFLAYVTARWQDMTGKIRYRLGGYTRARIAFETAVSVAGRHRLWWCLPDMRSNVHRGRYEESRQSGAPHIETLIESLTAERERILRDAAEHGVATGDIDRDAPIQHREYLRGYSSVLHNLALALKDKSVRDKSPDDARQSLAVSEESIRISQALGDHFRIYQSLNHQALLDPERAPELFHRLAQGPYVRGRLIARQHLAIRKRGMESVRELRTLMEELISAARAHGSTGLDIHVAAITMDQYAAAVAEVAGGLDDAERIRLTDDVAEKRFLMAESVRRVVAMPAYKQAYSRTIRPSFLERIADRIASSAATGEAGTARAEEAFGLVEASSARELLDMLSTAAMPELPPLPRVSAEPAKWEIPAAAEAAMAAERGPEADAALAVAGPGRRRTVVRRGAVRRAGGDVRSADRSELARRETEFEEAFLQHPIEGTPADAEIAHRVRMFTVNNPDTCVVRYFAYGPAAPAFLGAFVFRDGDMQRVTGIPYAEVETLAQEITTDHAPARAQCEAIWRTLLAPVWDHVRHPAEPGHLVLVPTDALFAIPLHLAWAPEADVPLAARLPMSLSVSATAFVSRGRSFLRRQPVSTADDLAAIVIADEEALGGRRGVSGGELLDSGWQPEHMIVLGARSPGLSGVRRFFAADTEGFRQLMQAKPEFFVYAGHGGYDPQFAQLGPYLDLNGTYLTQYDVALRLRLPRNKLTVLGACLAGQGAKTDSGEVSGFLRSLIAAGAGAIGMPLWSVEDGAMIRTVGPLLAASRAAVSSGAGVYDPVQALHERYRHVAGLGLRPEVLTEYMPFCLYL